MEAEEPAEAAEEDGEDDDAEEGAWPAARDALAGILGGTETLAAAAARTALETLAPVMRREGWEAAPWEARRACMVVAQVVAESSRAVEAARGAPWRALVWNATVTGLQEPGGGRAVAAWALRAADALLGARPAIAPPPAQQIALAAALVPALSRAAAAAAPLAVVRACKVPIPDPLESALSLPPPSPLPLTRRARGRRLSSWRCRCPPRTCTALCSRASSPLSSPSLPRPPTPPRAPALRAQRVGARRRGGAWRSRQRWGCSRALRAPRRRRAGWRPRSQPAARRPPRRPLWPRAPCFRRRCALPASSPVPPPAPRPPPPSPTRLAPVLAPLERRR
jgi:hypothetical protein